jgi:hypothetical protein
MLNHNIETFKDIKYLAIGKNNEMKYHQSIFDSHQYPEKQI